MEFITSLWKKPSTYPTTGARVPVTGNGITGGKKPKKVVMVTEKHVPKHRKKN